MRPSGNPILLRSTLQLSKVCMCHSRKISQFYVFLIFYLYGSPFLLWNIVIPFLMHMDMESAYMVAHLEISTKILCIL